MILPCTGWRNIQLLNPKTEKRRSAWQVDGAFHQNRTLCSYSVPLGAKITANSPEGNIARASSFR